MLPGVESVGEEMEDSLILCGDGIRPNNGWEKLRNLCDRTAVDTVQEHSSI